MKDRDSNETGHVSRTAMKPEPDRLELVSRPLITEDYGGSAELQYLATLARSGRCIMTATRKVDTESRYVVEFQVVCRQGGPLMFDVQSLGGEC